VNSSGNVNNNNPNNANRLAVDWRRDFIKIHAYMSQNEESRLQGVYNPVWVRYSHTKQYFADVLSVNRPHYYSKKKEVVFMNAIEEVMSFEALYESHLKAQQGVIWKDSVARFSLHGFEEIL